MKIAVDVGAAIKSARRAKGISTKFVADKLDVSPSTISKWESNERKIRAEYLPALANILGVPVETFFDSDVGKTPTQTAV